jgi:hypothetical protein
MTAEEKELFVGSTNNYETQKVGKNASGVLNFNNLVDHHTPVKGRNTFNMRDTVDGQLSSDLKKGLSSGSGGKPDKSPIQT